MTKYRLSHVTALTLVWALGGCADMQGALMDLGEAGQGAAGSVTNAGGDPVAVETAPGASGAGMGGAAALPPADPEAPTGEDTAVPLQPGAGADAGTSSEEPGLSDPATAAADDAGSEAVVEPPEPDPVEPPVVVEPPEPDPVEPPVVVEPPEPDPVEPPVVEEPPEPDPVEPPVVEEPPEPDPVEPPVVVEPPEPDPVEPPVVEEPDPVEPPEPDPVEPPVVEEPDPVEPPVVPPSFQADVWPIFIANCGTCHTTLRRGGHSVGSPVLATADADARRLGATLIERLDGGGMPPRCSGSPGDVGCIAVADLAMIQLWIDTGMAP